MSQAFFGALAQVDALFLMGEVKMAGDKSYIAMAEEIAKTIVLEMAERVPELNDMYIELACAGDDLRNEMIREGRPDVYEDLSFAVNKHLNHTMLREMFALIHPKHKGPFFYLNDEFLKTDSSIKGQVQAISMVYPSACRKACNKYIRRYRKLMDYFEKQTTRKTREFISECYSYYC